MRGVSVAIVAILILTIQAQTTVAWGQNQSEVSLSASGRFLTVGRGCAISTNITITSEGDSPGSAQLILSWDHRVPKDVSYSFNPSAIGVGQSSRLTFVTHSDSSIGNFHFHVIAVAAHETGSLRMSLKIKQHTCHLNSSGDFSLTANPLSLTAQQGASNESTIGVTGFNGFNSPVSLGISWMTGSSPAGVSSSFQSSNLTPNATTVLTLSTSSNTPLGTYKFLVMGISGDIGHETDELTLTVTASNPPPPPSPQADFTLQVTPGSWTVNPGETIDYNISLAPVNGFDSPVSITVTPSTLTNATITLTQTTATPPAKVQLHIVTAKTLKNDTYTFQVVGTSGSLTHQATVYLVVLPVALPPPPAISLTLTLSKTNVTLGEKTVVTVQFTPKAGFNDTTVIVSYSNLSNTAWRTLDTVTTNKTAGYSLDWTPNKSGYFIVKAVWLGNTTFTGAISNYAIIQVNPSSETPQPAPPEFPWFWLAIAALIIIGVATAVTLRIRKKPIPTPSPTAGVLPLPFSGESWGILLQ